MMFPFLFDSGKFASKACDHLVFSDQNFKSLGRPFQTIILFIKSLFLKPYILFPFPPMHHQASKASTHI